MKIVIVTDAWLPQINGVVTSYVKTVRELQKRGHDVTMITPESFRSIPCPTYPEIQLSLVRPATISQTLNLIGPNSIHIATEGPLGWAARRACITGGFGFTTSYHTRFPEYIRIRFPLPLKLTYTVMRRFHNRGVGMMVSSRQLKKEMEDRGFNNVRLWFRGVDTDLFKPEAAPQISVDQKIFTYLGRVAPEKNLEAFLNLDLPGIKMVIGDGPALAGLQSRYPDVNFTGFKKGRELASLLASSSVFVFPSLTDTLGVVQLEAMACGVPVAAFPVSGPKSVIINGYNGWMHDDLQTAVMKCLDINPEACRQYALSHTWEECTDQFLNNLFFTSPNYTIDGQLIEKAA